MLARLGQWFAARSAQEQRSLRLGGVAALLVLLIGALLPLHGSIASRSARVTAMRADLGWLRSMSSQLAAAASLPSSSPESLVVVVDRVARATGIAAGMSSSQQSANGSVDVHLERVSFDALATWLGQLTQLNGVQVESASIEGAGTPGLVRATLVLRQR
jgi:type II secretory pathway component PulM